MPKCARAQAVSAEEKVFTAREVEMAERKKAIDLIGAAQAAEREALRLTSAAQAENAGQRRPRRGDPRAGRRPMPMPTRSSRWRRKRARRDRGRGHAPDERGAERAVARGALSVLRLRLVEKAEAIIRESVRPMERIEGIKILHVDGLGGSGGGGDGDGSNGGSFADSVGQLGPALSRAGAAGRPVAARDRARVGRHPAAWRRACRRATAALPPAPPHRRSKSDQP